MKYRVSFSEYRFSDTSFEKKADACSYVVSTFQDYRQYVKDTFFHGDPCFHCPPFSARVDRVRKDGKVLSTSVFSSLGNHLWRWF